MIILKILAIYLLIGLIIDVIINGKRIVECLANGSYGYIDTLLGTIVMAFICPVTFVYGVCLGIRDEINSNREGT